MIFEKNVCATLSKTDVYMVKSTAQGQNRKRQLNGHNKTEKR